MIKNRLYSYWYVTMIWIFIISCDKSNRYNTTPIPDRETVMSLLTSKTWYISKITHSKSLDSKCNGKYTNSPSIDCNMWNVVELRTDFTYTEKRSGGVCLFPLSDVSGSWTYDEPELCIGSKCYGILKITGNELILIQNSDSHYDCHSQATVYHSTVYQYY